MWRGLCLWLMPRDQMDPDVQRGKEMATKPKHL